ncbi:DUF3667 domain-containing protein [Aurantibacter crassamenti]|uniref:DUF3667 domain-containing protein n=1 Tax=Aurantibacter crassamenti TaxID=1837375 RepID=UPI00193AC90E|nr:DUF3667 domain-containing protein [Aurantibacter crassamenti]MBM1108075.1 DUF3667 domain-containing protein [Aurantibacter crassamenti]
MSNKPTLPKKGNFKIEHRGSECLNCGHSLRLTDKFCPNCSQANNTKKLSLNDFFDEFFASMISYDSKLLRTLSALLTKPGKITADFIAGKRASYTNPFRFLLSLTIIYFLMINFGGNYSNWDKYGSNSNEPFLIRLSNWVNSFDGLKQKQVKEEIASVAQDTDFKEYLSAELQKDSIILSNPKKYFNSITDASFLNRHSKKNSFFNTVIRKDSVFDFEDAQRKYDIPNTSANSIAFNAASGLLKFNKQPGTFISSLISKLPFAIFFFLPVFTIFIWLAYIRKKYSYTDHLIFSFHSTSLFFILLIISYLFEWLINKSVNWVFLILFCIYLFIAMKRFYQQGFFKTSVKYVFLNTIFFILAMFSMLILLTGNVFTF